MTRRTFYIYASFVAPRFFLCWGTIAMCWVWTSLVMIGQEKNVPITKWRRRLLVKQYWYTAKLMMLAPIYIKKKFVDYSEYLGPDWTASFENPGSIVANHQCFLDVILQMMRQEPSHVSKEGVKKIPWIGPIAVAISCLFVERGSNTKKFDLLGAIEQRQRECE